jgi:alanine-glyoxylate transaminase/serine-glyoxylate transaminase/serine-pyruvate transaminase
MFGPGPSQVEPRVYQAMAQPMVGLLDHYFFEIIEEIRKDLRVLFGTQNPFVHVLS